MGVSPTVFKFKKKKAKSSVEYLRYPGLGFDPEEASATPSAYCLAGGVQFMSPVAHASAVAGGELPPGSSSSIDTPLSPRTHVVREELCLEASPPTLPREGEHQIQGQETEIARDDPYVPQEVRTLYPSKYC